MTEITQTNAAHIASKLRQGIDNGGIERDALALWLDWFVETLETDRSIINRLEGQLRQCSDQLTDAVHRAQEAEYNLHLMTKQSDANYKRAKDAEEQLVKFRIVTVARVYNGEPMDCDGDGSGPGCEHAALWEVQAMEAEGSNYTHLCSDHLNDYQKWAADDGRLPMVFEVEGDDESDNH